MTSSPQDRLDAIYRSYAAARDNMDADMAEADDDEADRIRKNLAKLKTAYYRAEEEGLAANGLEVEAAYQTAVDAAQRVEQAYDAAMALSERIGAVAGAVTAVAGLMQKAAAV